MLLLRNYILLAAPSVNIYKVKAQFVWPYERVNRAFLILFMTISVNAGMREKPTAHQLFEELQVKGYRGSETQVKDFVARLRRGFSGMKHPPKAVKTEGVTPTLSPKSAWPLLVCSDVLSPAPICDGPGKTGCGSSLCRISTPKEKSLLIDTYYLQAFIRKEKKLYHDALVALDELLRLDQEYRPASR